MKFFCRIIILICIFFCSNSYAGAPMQLPDAKLTIKVVDEDNKPLPHIPIHVWLSEAVIFDSQTDSNGVFVAEGKCTVKEVPIRIVKEGFYDSMNLLIFTNYPNINDNKWYPWNPVVTAVVRRIINPIPMFAKCLETKIPKTNECFGYDLEIGDWVTPAGKGVVSDLVFSIEGVWQNYRDNDSTLTLTFSQPNDGLVTVGHDVLDRRPTGSKFILPRNAADSGYVNCFKWRRVRKQLTDSIQDQVVDDVNVEGRDYIFRVRSQTNEAGVVTNACYGKFHGNIEFVGAAGNSQGSWLKFTYYLNPNPNDRNLEFDPKRNLFKNLKSTEEVREP